MYPKIAIVLTPNGIETVSVLPSDSETRSAGYEFCTLLEEELRVFEATILQKMRLAKWNLQNDETQ